MDDTMLISEDLKRELWKVPVGIDLIKDKSISHGAFRLYLNLLGYARTVATCFPSREKLSKDMGCTVKTIDRLKAELKKLKLLDWKQALGKDGREHNTYELLKYTPIAKGRGGKNVSPRRTEMSHDRGQERRSNNTNSKNTKKKNNYNKRDCDTWDEPTIAARTNIEDNDRTTSGTEGFESDSSNRFVVEESACYSNALEAEDEERDGDEWDGPALKKDVAAFVGIYIETRNKLGLRELTNMDAHIPHLLDASYDDIKWYLEDETRIARFFEYCDDKSYDMRIRHWECNSKREPAVMVNESVMRRYMEWLEGGHSKDKGKNRLGTY